MSRSQQSDVRHGRGSTTTQKVEKAEKAAQSDAGYKVPKVLVARALSYISRRAHDPTCDRQKLGEEMDGWRGENPRHEQAYQLALKYWGQTEAASKTAFSTASIKDRIGLPPAADERRAVRRRTIKTLAWGGFAALLSGTAGRWWWQQPLQRLALRTEHGQQLLAQKLEDGSVLDLAAMTTLEVTLYRDRRLVNLSRGEARFAVARDEDRPFCVTTPWGTVKVLGTVFTVAVQPDHMDVSVASGRVEVRALPTSSAGAAGVGDTVTLEGGQQLEVNAMGMQAPRPISPDSVGAWRDGWLVFDQTVLPEVISRWNDYLREPLQLADSGSAEGQSLRQMRITGAFPLRDPDAFLRNLPLMLPVNVERQSGRGVISPR